MSLARGQFWTPRPAYRAWGRLRRQALPQPAAHAELSWTSPPGFVRRVVVFSGELKVEVALKECSVSIQVKDGDGVVWYQTAKANGQAANSTTLYEATPLHTSDIGTPPATTIIAFPDILLVPGLVVTTQTAGIEGADQWSKGQLWVEDFPLDGPDIVAEHEALYRRIAHLERMVEHGEAVHA